MSSGGAFGGARGYQPRPPEKGVFPLDHFGECKQVGAHRACQEVALLLLSASAVSLKAYQMADIYSLRASLQPTCASAACCHCSLPPGPARAAIAAQFKDEYVACLKAHSNEADACQEVAGRYLQCRMERCAPAAAAPVGLLWAVAGPSNPAACSPSPCRGRLHGTVAGT